MKKTSKLISILIAVAMLLSMAPISAFAASVVASGKFGASGSNLTWSLDSDGVLTISGSGAMEDFANVSKVPWYSKRTNVKTVIIESGVTNIGKDAFYGISSLVNATISDTVTSIGNRAFSGSGLTNFEFSDAGNLKTIGNSAFNSTQIKNMVIPDGVTTLGSYIFGYGPIKSVTIPASVTSIGNYFFEETSSLNEVIFLGNKEPETIGDTVFLGCSSLAYVSVPADYEGDTFSNMKVSKAVSSVAEVNGQGFATLADAISAAQSISGAELKLLSHISIDSGITIESGKFTIDLNGKELFSNGYFLLRIDGADVTIVDSAGGGIFNASNDQGNIVLEVLSGSANISGGTFNSAGYPATVRDGTLKLTGKDFVLNGNWRIGWYGGSIDLSACTADEVRIQACADGLQASAITLPDGWGLFKTDGTPCTDFVKNDIYVAKAGFKVTASVNPAEGGTVEGAGTYSSGATVNLTASAANGYRFVNWIENGEEVSTSAIYTFTASKNRELTANFEIVPHTHSFTYSASGDTITAVCANTDGNCPDSEGTLTILAPADLYADGITAKEATIENNLVDTSVAISDITYSAPYGLPPKDAGTYTASVTVGGATARVEFTLLNYAAKVTDKDGNAVGTYKTFEDAITAAEGSEGSTITLLDDITLTKEQNIRSGKFTLDLNGKNLINENSRVLYILEEADLTIKDSGEGGTIETKDESVDCIYNYGKLTVESGIIKGDGGIRNFGVLYFNDGTVEADNYPAIANYNDSTVYVYDGVLKGGKNSGAVENGGKLYVYGGEIESIVNVNDAYISGGKIDRDDNVALNLLGGTVEITGGSFTGTDRASGYYSGTPYGEWTVYYGEDATLTLKGGEFPNGFVVANTTANAFLAEGYAFYDKDGNKITVADDAKIIDGYVQVKEHFVASVTDKDGNAVGTYKTLADAITAASASEGSTVTLLDDCNVSDCVEITSGTFIFDLAGNSLTISGSNTALFVDGSDINLTIADSIGGGKIYASSMSFDIIAAQCVTINNGIFDGYLSLRNGSLIINGGTFYKGTVRYSIGDDDGTNVAIYGGEFPEGFYAYLKSPNDYLADGCYFRDAENRIITVADGATAIKGYVKVSKGADLSEAVVTVDKTEFVYNGQHQAPAVTVTIGGKTLTENVDYAVNARRWENDVPVQWFYYVDAGVYTSDITGLGDYTGTVKKEFVIKPATVDIIWEGDVFYYTGNPHEVTAKYVDVNGDENPAAITQNKTNTEIGKYIATAVVEDANYTVNGATINHAYEIKWYDGAPDAAVSGTKGENGWYTSEVTVTAPEGYAISTLADGIYGSEITFGNEENAVYYLKQTENGYIAKVELGEIKCDLADPAAEITMAENKWNSFFNTVTFGYFFKETQSITITASDETSGIAKIEYVVATEEITDFENAEWIEYTEAFTIQPNSKNVIYAKATDKAGRTIIINSDGIVVYSDSQVTTADTLIYTLTTIEDVEYSVDFKGNTVDYVKINNDELSTDEYEATENSIIIKGEYVENLAADVVYEIVIGIDPMGENFAVGDAPAEMKAYLAVEKITGSVIIINDISKVYDGTPVEAPQYETIGTGEVTIKYTSAIGEPQYTDVVPTEAGTYFVVAEIAETNKSTYDFGVAEFTIAKADSAITAAPTPNTLTYNGKAHNLISAGEATGGTMVYSLDGTEYSETIPKGTDAGDYTVYYKVIGDSNHNDTEPATVIVTINAKDISDGFIILGAPLTYNGKEQTQTVEKVLPTGTAPEATYTVGGNKATNVGVYLLTVTGTGNFTGEAKIAYEIALDDECISHLDRVEDNGVMKWNVKSTDRESLEYVIDQLNNAVTDIADADTKNEWADTKEACEDMLRIINSIELAIADVEEDYAGFSEDTVKSSDIPALDEIVSKVNEIKDRYGFNLTDEEAKKLEDILDGIEKLKAKIAETAEEIERIDEAVNGYDEETVTSDDIPELDKLIEDIKALTDSDNLTEDEKAALEETEKAIDELVEKLAEVAEEIKKVDEAVKSYDEETVKSTDKEDLAQLKEDIQALIDSTNTTENEKTALEEMIEKVEGLEDKIEEIETQLERIEGIENIYNPETVTSDDKAAIQKTIDEIEAVNPDNLTDEQKAEYEEIKAGLEALLDEIAAAEKDVADIGIELEKFDEERVTKFWEDDIEALKAKINELLADENMGEAEKAKLDEYKAQAEKLIEIINTPKEYFSLRFFYLIWDCLTWKYNGILGFFSQLFAK